MKRGRPVNSVDFYGDWQKDTIERAINAALAFEGVTDDCSVEVMIVGEDEIRAVNNEQRGIDRVTDVLSFPMFESKDMLCADEFGTAFLGSMMICRPRAEQQAKEYGHSVSREAAFLAVHSVLHLLGYDHELGKDEEKEMFAKQEQILTEMGLSR